MRQKAVKAAKPPVNENLDLLRLELERNKFELEKSKFEHQKAIDGQRLAYETKKSPPNLTKWLAIAAIVLSPLVSAAVGIVSARLVFDGKVMELKNQEALKMLDLQYGMTTHLMSNWKALNSLPPEDRRNMAKLIKGFFPEQQSFQIFATLERNSPPAAKAIWREAKASVIVQQSAAEMASQTDEKAESPARESKSLEMFRSIGGAHSASPFLTGGSSTFLLNDINKPDSGGFASVSGWNSAGTVLDTYLAESRASAVPVAFKEAPGIGDYFFPSKQPSYLTSVELQITAAPNVLGDSQVTITLTDGQLANDPYRIRTPVNLRSPSASTINISEIGTFVTKSQSGVDAASGIWITGSRRPEGKSSIVLDSLGSLGADVTGIKTAAPGYSFTLPDTQPGSLTPNGIGTIKAEKTPQITIDAGKLRVQ